MADPPEWIWPDHDDVLTAAELSILRWRHAPVVIPPCRVCGAELTIGSMGGGQATKYSCSSPEASSIGDKTREERRDASDHYAASIVNVAYHGDPKIVRVIDELVALRSAAGEDMVVPVGFVFLHSVSDCYPLVHVGDGVWENRHRCEVHGVRPEGEYRCADCDLMKP